MGNRVLHWNTHVHDRVNAVSRESLGSLSGIFREFLMRLGNLSGVSHESLGNLSGISRESFSSLSAVSQQSLWSHSAVSLSLSALSLTYLALRFLIPIIILWAYFIKPAEHKYFVLLWRIKFVCGRLSLMGNPSVFKMSQGNGGQSVLESRVYLMISLEIGPQRKRYFVKILKSISSFII